MKLPLLTGEPAIQMGAMMAEFGELVKKYRTDRKMNLEALAPLLNLSPSALSDIETGKRNLTLISILQIGEKLSIGVEVKFK